MGRLELARAGAQEGSPLVSAKLHFPLIGAWSADVQVASGEALTGKVDLLIDETRWVATVARGGVFDGSFRARLFAGGNGLRSKAEPRQYTSPTLGIVLADVAKDVGEAISGTADASITGVQLEHWTTMALPASQLIRCLLDFAPAQVVWRHLADGTIWLGQDAFEDGGIEDFAEVNESPEDGSVDLQLVSPLLYPGTTIGGRRIDSALVTVTGSETRARIWLAD